MTSESTDFRLLSEFVSYVYKSPLFREKKPQILTYLGKISYKFIIFNPAKPQTIQANMQRVYASHQELVTVIEPLVRLKGWQRQSYLWAREARVSLLTLKRFWRGMPLPLENFANICKSVGFEEYDTIAKPVSGDPFDGLAVDDSGGFKDWLVFDSGCVGRNLLVAKLQNKLQRARLLGLMGLTGIGKTAVAERLAHESRDCWQKILRINFDDLEKCQSFGVAVLDLLNGIGATVSVEQRQNANELINWLFTLLATQPYLVILDSVENILEGNIEEGWSAFKDPDWLKFFKRILTASSFASCVILTSQDLPQQLEETGGRYPHHYFCQALQGLDGAECLDLFYRAGFEMPRDSLAEHYIRRISTVYEGHPLALRTIAGEMGDAPFYGDVVSFWERYGTEIERIERILEDVKLEINAIGKNDYFPVARLTKALYHRVRSRLNHTLDRLKTEVPFAYRLLCEVSIYRCAVPSNWWLSHFDEWDDLPEDWHESNSSAILNVLQDRFLVEEDPGRNLSLHNLVRSVALERFKKEFDTGEQDVLPFDFT